MEREKGFEPSTLALGRRCSTTELFPQNSSKLARGAVLAKRPDRVKREHVAVADLS